MKSLEHIIREIREGKCECEKKKDSLEHAIRKVKNKEYESSYAAKDSKPVDEAVGTLGTDKYQGNEFKSIRSATPHIKPPGPEHGHSQAPENASRQRTIAKEKQGINRVEEQAAPAAALGLGALAATSYLLAPKGKVKVPSPSGAPDIVDKILNPPEEELTRAKEAIKAGTKTKPKDEPEVEAANKAAGEKAKKASEKPKAPPAEEQPKPPEVSVKKPEEFVPNKDAAAAAPQPKGPQGPEMPPLYPAQTRPETKTAPGTKTRPVEIPTPDKTEPAPKRKEIGPPMPAETKPAPAEPAPKKWKEVGPEMPATKPELAPAAEPSTETKTAVQPSGVVHPTTGANIAANAGRAAVAPKTDTAVNTKTVTDADTKTADDGTENKKSSPGLGFKSSHDFGSDTLMRLFNPKKVHIAKKHRVHEDTKSREEIENMPRKGDRKSIEYVGRKDAETKTAKEKTSRLATIKNVIDEAKKEKESVAKKQTSFEDGKTKVFDYGQDILVISPDQRKVGLDVDNGEKIAKDYGK